MKRIWIPALVLGLALAGSAAGGEMTQGMEMWGGKNGFAEMRLRAVPSDAGTVTLRVEATGAGELQGYGFVLRFDPEKYAFVEARETADNLLETGAGAPRLFLAASRTDGEVAVGAMKVDGEAGAGDGALVELRFEGRDVRPGDFEISEGMLVDLSGAVDGVLGVGLASGPAPPEYGLAQNAPNPFNPATSISYQLPEAGRVKLVVYNLLGQEVRTLVNDFQDAGAYTAHWDGRDRLGNEVASGVYLYRMEAGGFRQVRRMTLLK